MNLESRWTALWESIGLAPPADAGFRALLARYREPHRAYHTDQHLAECLSWLDEARALARRAAVLELAIWYHDAIYWPRRSDNEAASAALATSDLRAAGASDELTDAVASLIGYTTHQSAPPPGDPALLVDIDLAILGANHDRFEEYERQIREEYRWVPAFVFRRRRSELLRSFLDRPRLYSTGLFFDRLEAPARRNLADAIKALGSA